MKHGRPVLPVVLPTPQKDQWHTAESPLGIRHNVQIALNDATTEIVAAWLGPDPLGNASISCVKPHEFKPKTTLQIVLSAHFSYSAPRACGYTVDPLFRPGLQWDSHYNVPHRKCYPCIEADSVRKKRLFTRTFLSGVTRCGHGRHTSSESNVELVAVPSSKPTKCGQNAPSVQCHSSPEEMDLAPFRRLCPPA